LTLGYLYTEQNSASVVDEITPKNNAVVPAAPASTPAKTSTAPAAPTTTKK
jgi:preprotein translocase subunit SecG